MASRSTSVGWLSSLIDSCRLDVRITLIHLILNSSQHIFGYTACHLVELSSLKFCSKTDLFLHYMNSWGLHLQTEDSRSVDDLCSHLQKISQNVYSYINVSIGYLNFPRTTWPSMNAGEYQQPDLCSPVADVVKQLLDRFRHQNYVVSFRKIIWVWVEISSLLKQLKLYTVCDLS